MKRNTPHQKAIAEKKRNKFQAREQLANTFLLEFSALLLLAILLYAHMALYSYFPIFMRNFRLWAPLGLALICLIFVLPAIKTRKPIFKHFAVFFGGYALLYAYIALHLLLGKFAILPFMGFGVEWSALKFCYAWLALAFIFFIIKYIVKYRKMK